MKNVLRLLLAIIFIISGFVKAVDPVGFSFKLEEYFSPAVFNLPFLEQFALPLSIAIVAVEFLLGVFLLLKIRTKKTLYLLLAICIFFAFLTFYSAYFNVVTDCGCFGDALKLTPWTSFAKDIILLVLILILLRLEKNDQQNNICLFKSGFFTQLALSISVIFLIIFILAGVYAEPLIDFRDYKIGTDLKVEKAKIAENPSLYKVFYTLKNKKTGEEKTMSQDDYISTGIWEDANWEILTDKTTEKEVEKGYDSTIKNFRITDAVSGEDVTDKILNEPRVFMVFTYKPQLLSAEEIQKLEKGMLKKDSKIYAVSTDPNTFSKVPHGTMDGTAIKTIARSNPFILILENGKIVDKEEGKDYFNK
ncbi:BT_3928 family protein [Elizabethkingia sp. JS20170427COW]|uniref:BT_3928 family protein n=1 Tax=Elizabethkingia sp. JS20170427COW TaxID=2583851 RepID=UPI00111069CB|nr:BT_3928 family protein [Elizabethkingia sp. JS20170427COW]QCX53854.1 DoxX family protein [Elizabethkingia sp. JS20170427COW]